MAGDSPIFAEKLIVSVFYFAGFCQYDPLMHILQGSSLLQPIKESSQDSGQAARFNWRHREGGVELKQRADTRQL